MSLPRHQFHLLSLPTTHHQLQNNNGASMIYLPLAPRRFSAVKAPAISAIRRGGVVQVRQSQDQGISNADAMADAANNNNQKQPEQVLAGGSVSKKEVRKELPPPPEKPEQGDCCGSGCVRCVWDIYYEELDAYNELCKEFSSSSQHKSEYSPNR